ncbi:MAG: metallophosphoesterase [Spirochaetales bacterium]|nr:metallophosphoesterase [Spirochaetales bacterium]
MKYLKYLLFSVILLNSCLLFDTKIDSSLAEVKLEKEVGDGDLKFMVVADIHPEMSSDSLERMDAFLTKANDEKVDFIIQLGDFVEPAEDPTGEIIAKWNSFPGNKLHVLGNHDMDHGSKQEVMKYWGIRSNCYFVDVKGTRLIVLDPNFFVDSSNRFVNYSSGNYYAHSSTRGTIPPSQLAWLDQVISEASGRVMVFSHQSLSHPGSIKNSSEVRSLFERYNKGEMKKVVACFNGHEHVDVAENINGIYYIQINSTTYQWLGGNIGRYSEEEYSQLSGREKDLIMYDSSLFAIVTLEESRLVIKGVEGSIVGPLPDMEEYSKLYNGLPLSASITDKVLEL